MIASNSIENGSNESKHKTVKTPYTLVLVTCMDILKMMSEIVS